ncbi:MAG: TlpA disulfide reductase family protein [Nitrospiria bacterium]
MKKVFPQRSVHHSSQPFRLFLIIFLVLFIQTGCDKKGSSVPENSNSPKKIGIEVGDIAPDFILKKLKGGETSLSSYKGKVVLVNFWATWCGPCRAEMPSMEKLYQDYSRDDFEILAVSIDFDKEAPVKAFIEEFGFTFPVPLDDQLEVNNRYQIRVVPTSILVDQNGIIKHRLLGAKDWSARDSNLFIDQLIAQS